MQVSQLDQIVFIGWKVGEGMREFIFREAETLIPVKGKRLVAIGELVRCKDCIYGEHEKNESTGMEWIYCQHHRENRPPEWYCADGEART